MRVCSLGQEDPLEEEVATHSSILAWKFFMDRGSCWATVHRVAVGHDQAYEHVSNINLINKT